MNNRVVNVACSVLIGLSYPYIYAAVRAMLFWVPGVK